MEMLSEFTPLKTISCLSSFAAAFVVFGKFKTFPQKKAEVWAGSAILSVCVADILSILSYSSSVHESLLVFKISEILYLIFVFFDFISSQ